MPTEAPRSVAACGCGGVRIRRDCRGGWKPRTKPLRIGQRRRQISRNDRLHFVLEIHERRFFTRQIMSAKHTRIRVRHSRGKRAAKNASESNKPWGRLWLPKVFVHSDSSYGNAKKVKGRQASEGRGERAAEQVKSRMITEINDSISCPFRVTDGDRDDSNCEYVIWIGDGSDDGHESLSLSLLLHN